MHARVVDLQVRPMDTEEMVRIYRNSVVPAAKEQPGFKGALLLTDSGAGVGLSITLWETEEDREAGETGDFYREQINKFSALFVSTPVRKHYDVSVMV